MNAQTDTARPYLQDMAAWWS